MKKRELVSHIMTTDVFKVNLSDSLYKVKSMLEKKHIRHLPVVSNHKLKGIISLTDILRISFGSNFGDNQKEVDTAIFDMLTIEQVMNSNPRTITSKQSIKEVAEILTKEEFHALPVVDDDELVGIVTTTDIVKYLLEQY
ncbi:MAG: CBS domain-containing protein [Cyclobacteriaceae bacterium]|nr:CBS domain-containing protein [Cyclobacteriaceae bacterium]